MASFYAEFKSLLAEKGKVYYLFNVLLALAAILLVNWLLRGFQAAPAQFLFLIIAMVFIFTWKGHSFSFVVTPSEAEEAPKQPDASQYSEDSAYDPRRYQIEMWLKEHIIEWPVILTEQEVVALRQSSVSQEQTQAIADLETALFHLHNVTEVLLRLNPNSEVAKEANGYLFVMNLSVNAEEIAREVLNTQGLQYQDKASCSEKEANRSSARIQELTEMLNRAVIYLSNTAQAPDFVSEMIELLNKNSAGTSSFRSPGFN